MVIGENLTPCGTLQPDCIENPIHICIMHVRAITAEVNIPYEYKNFLFLQAMTYTWQTCSLKILEINRRSKSFYKHLTGE